MPALKGQHCAIEIMKVEKHTKITDSQASKYLCCQHILSEIRLAMFCYGTYICYGTCHLGKVPTELYCGEGWKEPRHHSATTTCLCLRLLVRHKGLGLGDKL